MSDLESRIKELEEENEHLRLDVHALQVAVVTISAVVNEAVGKSKGLMAETVENSLSYDSNLDQSEEYFNKLKTKVIELLGKSSA
ncbi:hypothetical protein NGI10_03725 [Raoultella ornithinolytica]|uniref:hypothetical protein n=1 Tax=Raoultella ornithinolytica TaxID=54291 RepID=UPI002DBF980A|nr:hypothetical protein [Raoultella ornithinolytica]MEB8212236.1 hypothetical protein [Raoultella ornithinolytica]